MNSRTVQLTRLALLLALAVVIHTAESLLPVTFLWFRFGFANIITLVVLYLFGFRSALFVTLGRVFLGSMISGTLGSPAFVLSLSGNITAVAAMGFALYVFGRWFSEVGISLIGAVLHNFGQLVAAYFVVVRNESVFLLLPFMMIAAIITGLINGLSARFVIQIFKNIDYR